MHDRYHSRFQCDIKWRHRRLSLSLYYSQKSLTHNIGSASALPIISCYVYRFLATRLQMHVKQYSSLGEAIFDRLGNSARKDPDTMFTRKKDPDSKPPFSKDPLSEAFSEKLRFGAWAFSKSSGYVRIRVTDSTYLGSKTLRFREDPGTCARSVSKLLIFLNCMYKNLRTIRKNKIFIKCAQFTKFTKISRAQN